MSDVYVIQGRPVVHIDRVMLRVARRWTSEDLRSFERSAARAFSEARVSLRAVRGARDASRALDLLLLADAHRQHGRNERVRTKACAAWLRGRQTAEDEQAWQRWRSLMLRIFGGQTR